MKAVPSFAAFCFVGVGGTLLIVASKVGVTSFPYPSVLLFLQGVVIACVLSVAPSLSSSAIPSVPRLSVSLVGAFTPIALLYVAAAASSLFALVRVGVQSFAVFSGLSAGFFSLFDWAVVAFRCSRSDAVRIAVLALSTAVYALSDPSLDSVGLIWLLLFAVSAGSFLACASILTQRSTPSAASSDTSDLTESCASVRKQLASSETLCATSIAYVCGLLSIPVFGLSAAITGEFGCLAFLFDRGPLRIAAALIPGFIVCASCIAVAVFDGRNSDAATLRMTASSSCFARAAALLSGEVFFARVLDPVSLAAAAAALVCSWLHSTHRSSLYSQRASASVIRTRWRRSLVISSVLAGLLVFGAATEMRSRRDAPVSPPRFGAQFETVDFGSFLPREPFRVAVEPNPGVSVAKSAVGFLSAVSPECNTSSPEWRTCDIVTCPRSDGKVWKSTVPLTTAWGEGTSDYIDRVLRIAWGPTPPSVDLYVRAGCRARWFMQVLFESVELFWPRFLGDVVVVLDFNDMAIADDLVPRKTKHHFKIAFEHCPCMDGRVLNQYSYLNADVHTTAEWVVTIDSDCNFHSPVTPDLLFRGGRIIHPRSHDFEIDMWNDTTEFFTGPGTYRWHTMVQQPVNYHSSSFAAYRAQFAGVFGGGKCLPERIAEFSRTQTSTWGFCWMCQLSSFIDMTKVTADKYSFYNCDDKDDPYPAMRYAIHFKWEPTNFEMPIDRVLSSMNWGLCRAFGAAVFPSCSGVDVEHLDEISFKYIGWPFSAAPGNLKAHVISWYVYRIRTIAASLQRR